MWLQSLTASRIWVQARKEWAEFRRDRLSLALALLLPLATLILFGYGVRLSARNIPLIVQDHDNSAFSRSFIQRLFATNVFVPGSWNGQCSPTNAIQSGGAGVAVVIPPGFGRESEMRRPVTCQALIDGTDVNSAELIRSVIRGTTDFLQSQSAPPDPAAYYIQPVLRVWFNPGGKESWFIVPGVFGIALWMYPALLAAVAVAREVEQGTIMQVYSSGMNAAELLLGKSLVYFAVGMAQGLLIMFVSYLLFGLTPAIEPSLLVTSTSIYVFAAVFFGLLAGALARTETVAVQITATGGFFPALLLSGFAYPVANIPFPLSLACLVVPARYYIQVCRDAFVKGAGWMYLWYAPLVLLLFAGLLFACAWSKTRRMQMGA